MRELASIAQAQLAAWEARARDWPIRVIPKDNGYHMVCAVCEQTLVPVSFHERSYNLTHDITIAATVAHLRNVHRWIESEVYGDDGSQDEKTTRDLGIGRLGDSRFADTG